MRFVAGIALCAPIVGVTAAPGLAQAALSPVQEPVPGATAGARPGPPRDAAPVSDTGTATITGRVLAADGTPLRRARVEMFGATVRQPRSTMTDGEGRYRFADLPAGQFNIGASKTGYVTLRYGQRRAYEQSRLVTVGHGQAVGKIDFTLPRGSVVVARVTDEHGEPLAGVALQAYRYEYTPEGQRQLALAVSSSQLGEVTDDRGELRLYGMMPGDYVVQAAMRGMLAPSSDTREGFSPTYYPGTVSADQAQTLTLGLGEEQSIYFAMRPDRLVRIAGIVHDAEGRPASGAQVRLVTPTGPRAFDSTGSAQAAADGTFALNGVAPGDYVLTALLRTPGHSLSTLQPVAVGGEDLTGLQLVLGSGATLSGRVSFDGTTARTAGATPFRVIARPVDPLLMSAVTFTNDPADNGTIDDAGYFRLSGVTGRSIVTVLAPPPWSVRCITAGGADVTAASIDVGTSASIADVRIVMTDKVTSVAGQVTNDDGRATDEALVVIVPANAAAEPLFDSMFTRAARPDVQGRFTFRLQPNTYVAIAVDSLEQGRQYSPEFQAQVRRRGREFTVREGQTVTVDLELVTGL